MEQQTDWTYRIACHPTRYANVLFRSRLEARWAAFFDLLEWKWAYEPIDFEGWTPDFEIGIPCGHSECRNDENNITHDLYVEVKPYHHASEFADHPLHRYNQPYRMGAIGVGLNPWVSTEWELSHGAGGGIYTLDGWYGWRAERSIDSLWSEAGNRTRYQRS